MIRRSVRELEMDEHKEERYALLKAWKAIKELDPSDPNSFWTIASYHGEPYIPRQIRPFSDTDIPGWGGYCQHANVLFPVWHRYYVCRIEKALQSIDPSVAMPYWDQTSPESLSEGIPDLLLDFEVNIDDTKKIPNPLLSYTYQKDILSHQGGEYYQKKAGSATVRYPLSAIQSPPIAKEKAEIHNAKMHNVYPGKNMNDALNVNVIQALNEDIRDMYVSCLQAETYNLFSNTSTAQVLNENMTVESPHNDIHLAVGGFDMGGSHSGIIEGSNGDMGANETAGFDPIFFFHHCNVDRVFWIWQQMHDATDTIEIQFDPSDPGTTNTGQGPTPYQISGDTLDMNTLLYPYENPDGGIYTGTACVNIANLGFDYSKGSLTDITANRVKSVRLDEFKTDAEVSSFLEKEVTTLHTGETHKYFINLAQFQNIDDFCASISSGEYKDRNYEILLKVENIPRDRYPGSFIIKAYFIGGNEKKYIGKTCVLDRWHRENCKNCQNRRFATATFKLHANSRSEHPKLDEYQVEVEYHTPDTGSTKIEIHNMHEVINGKISGKFFLTAELNR